MQAEANRKADAGGNSRTRLPRLRLDGKKLKFVVARVSNAVCVTLQKFCESDKNTFERWMVPFKMRGENAGSKSQWKKAIADADYVNWAELLWNIIRQEVSNAKCISANLMARSST